MDIFSPDDGDLRRIRNGVSSTAVHMTVKEAREIIDDMIGANKAAETFMTTFDTAQGAVDGEAQYIVIKIVP